MPFLVCALVLFGRFPAQTVATSEIDAVIARADSPREGDSEKMAKWGDKAFERLLPVAERRFAAEGASSENQSARAALANLTLYLCVSASRARTSEMTGLYRKAHNSEQVRLFQWMAEIGDVAPNRDLFDDAVWNGSEDPNTLSKRLSSVDALCRAGDRAALDALTRVLLKTSNPDLEKKVFWKIASTGDDAALNAVRKLRDRGRTLPPLAERSPLELQNAKNVKSTTTDKSGRRWGLIEWDGLGAPDDLWIVKREGNKWADPVFTGVNTSWPRSLPSGTRAKGAEEHDAMMASFVDKGGWKKLIDDPDTRVDTDGDGYTDLVERWLGLDPADPDTDGDGVPDGQDRNPLTGSPPQTDEEQAISAALSPFLIPGRGASHNTMIELPNGMKPFELYSSSGLVLPRNPVIKPEGRLFGYWFSVASPVAFSLDRGEATVSVTELGGYYSTGWQVRVRKFDGDWYAVDMKVVWGSVS